MRAVGQDQGVGTLLVAREIENVEGQRVTDAASMSMAPSPVRPGPGQIGLAGSVVSIDLPRRLLRMVVTSITVPGDDPPKQIDPRHEARCHPGRRFPGL